MIDTSRNLWVSQQKAGYTKLLGAATAVVGLIFILAVRQANGLSATTSSSALFLGILLLISGIAVLVINGKQTITVDPKRRLVLIETSSRFGDKRVIILFRDIVEVTLGEHGDTEGGSISYFIQLHLKSGKSANLFVGWVPEQWSRAEMEARRQRLIGYLEESA